MTSRIDALIPASTTDSKISDSKISDSESARAEAEAAHHAESRSRAAWVTAASAHDTEEFRELAEMLGLDRQDCQAARAHRSARRSGRHKAA